MKVKKKKPCKVCGSEFTLYKSTDRFCGYECAQFYEDEREKEQEKKKAKKADREKKKLKGISLVSSKRKTQLGIYEAKKKPYLAENTVCEVKGCGNESTHIHHKGGRRGVVVFYSPWFMAVCDGCHPAKIHENPDWSKREGYMMTGAEIDEKIKELKG